MIQEQKKVIEFDRNLYKATCQELSEILTLEKEVAAKKKELRDQVIKLAGGERMEYGIRVQVKTRKGTVNYKELVESLYPEEELEAVIAPYRGEDTEYLDVRKY